MDHLTAVKTEIVDEDRKPVRLRGVNLGGWLMMEAYILYAPNRAEQLFKKHFVKKLGVRALQDFEKNFRDHFIREKDIENIGRLGFNCIRVPFNFRLIEKQPYRYDRRGLEYLDRLISWAKEYGIWIILDLHAAPGAQNHDWHSDSLGKAGLWQRPEFQERVYALWEFLADHYRDEDTIAGYDLLNEAVLADHQLLNRFYQRLMKRIRAIDKRHILFVEGNHWAQDIDCLEDFSDDNLALSIHFYHPLEFTFNLVPQQSYPLGNGPSRFDRQTIRHRLRPYAQKAKRTKRPLYVGEFGVNAREGKYGEDHYLHDLLVGFEEFGFHWTYWTYKAVKNGILPDGIYSYLDNPAWVNRAGPLTGWETYANLWPQERQAIVKSWETDAFRPNPSVLTALQNALRYSATPRRGGVSQQYSLAE